MPHFIVEYSANLEPDIRMHALLLALRDAAMATGEFDLAAMRLRAEPREVYLIADGHPENGFIHIVARLRAGRDAATKQRIGEALLAAAGAHLEAAFATRPLALLIELQDVATPVFVRNTLNARVGQR